MTWNGNLPCLCAVEPNGSRSIGNSKVEGRLGCGVCRMEAGVNTRIKRSARIREAGLSGSLTVQKVNIQSENDLYDRLTWFLLTLQPLFINKQRHFDEE